jgi:c-di-GMP-binding flagellar brake protein YcgR
MIKETNVEKRNHRRKAVLAPALVKQYDAGGTKLDTAVITDISLGGIQIIIPKDAKHEISVAPQKSRFEVVFTLPNDNRPIYMTCETRRVVDSKETVRVGASFADYASQSYKELQTYLM